MGCCPRGVFQPLIFDCTGATRKLAQDETLLLGPIIVGPALDLLTPVITVVDPTGATMFEIIGDTAARGNLLVGRSGIGSVITTANQNTIFGLEGSGASLTTGVGNAMFGWEMAPLLDTGDSNMGMGRRCFLSLEDGSQNVGFGLFVLTDIVNTDNNTGAGHASLLDAEGSGNTAYGHSSGRGLVGPGDDNLFLGRGAGNTGQTNGVDNTICCGVDVVSTADNQIIIGNSLHDDTVITGILEQATFPSKADQVWDDVGVVRLSDGAARDRFFEEYAAGTVYTLTATPAELNFGTTDPILTITEPGTYRVSGHVTLEYVGATFAATQDVTLKLRRTNNTAADLTNGTTIYKLQIVTTLTGTAATIYWEASQYTTANTDDSLRIFADVAATPSAGSVTASAAFIKAEMILL